MWTIAGGWYRGSGVDSEWLYYNQIVPVTGRTEPVFRAVTIRTAEDIYALEDIVLADSTLTGCLFWRWSRADQLAAYNDLLTNMIWTSMSMQNCTGRVLCLVTSGVIFPLMGKHLGGSA